MAHIVFDLDGTLVDSLPDIHAAVSAMLRAEGLDPIDMDQVRQFVGHGSKVVERVLRHLGRPVDPEILSLNYQRFVAYYAKNPAVYTKPYPGVRPCLDELLQHGHTLGVCSNKAEGLVRLVLDQTGLGDVFVAVTGGDTVSTLKPDPLPLHHTFEQMGSGARLFIGDSEVDADTAVAAKVTFGLFTEGYRKSPVSDMASTFTFDAYPALPAAIKTALSREI